MNYKLTEETIIIQGHELHRIECVESFNCINKGDKGGYIESEKNLSQDGEAWVFGNAKVFGNAEVRDETDYIVFKNSWSSGRYFTWTKSNDKWKVGCFYGTGDELIRKAYKDSEICGKHYEAYVRLVDTLNKIHEE